MSTSAKLKRLESTASVSAIKSGLVMIIPVLLLGSAALVFEYFPITAYQDFIVNVFSGKLFAFFNMIYNATFGILSVYLCCAISFCFARQYVSNRATLASPITALICFFISSGYTTTDFKSDALGVKGVFIAIISSIIATKLLWCVARFAKGRSHGYAEDSDVEFNYAVSVIIPSAAVVAAFALVNLIITRLFAVGSIYELLINAADLPFMKLGRSFISGLLLVLISSVLWFFGIHGSDVLESVTEKLFTPAIDVNTALVSAGKAPTEIFTKQFFDNFVLMGGCGTAICLLLAVILFSSRRRNKRISKLAAVPMLFNINELMIFGYPVIYNTTLFIPFVITPLFSFMTTFIAMKTGLVPMTTAAVNWTAPVILSGYMVTGSIAGSILQIVNITAGVFIYRPFIKAYDRKCETEAREVLSRLTDIKKQSEETLTEVTLTRLTDRYGSLARSLASDLKYALEKKALVLYYQPQFDDSGECIGMEALMRWNHPLYGLIYPPLIIQLARESGFLTELEKYVLEAAIDDAEVIREKSLYRGDVSVNVSAATILTDEYLSLLHELLDSGKVRAGEICLEITEQTALISSDETMKNLQSVKDLGYLLAIDDFSMGHTSFMYLQASCFDIVKLDGSLVRDMMENERSLDIIKTITGLAHKLGFTVIAEYVETPEQVEKLKSADCFRYQGYLFSEALPADEVAERVRKQ